MEIKDKILKALENVNDPEIHKSLVELGMIGEIVVEGTVAKVEVILTTSGCPLKHKIRNDVQAAVLKVEGIETVNVSYGEMDKAQKDALIAKLRGQEQRENPLQGVKIIAVGSGKGGVGKSTVTVGMAMTLAKQGYKVGLIDADILGFSIPELLGIKHRKPMVIDGGLVLPIEKEGVKVISMGNLVDYNQVVVWRGPMLAKALHQFVFDVYWGELDYMFIDMPPGTGDIPLSIMETFPEANILIVTTPESLATGVAKRLGLMAHRVGCNIAGVVENMAYFVCDTCDKKHHFFGKGQRDQLCEDLGAEFLGEIPMVPFRDDDEEAEFDIKRNETMAMAYDAIAAQFIKQVV